jgi:hypothetical protein
MTVKLEISSIELADIATRPRTSYDMIDVSKVPLSDYLDKLAWRKVWKSVDRSEEITVELTVALLEIARHENYE